MARASAIDDVSCPAKSRLSKRSRICSFERLDCFSAHPRRSSSSTLEFSLLIFSSLSSIFLSITPSMDARDYNKKIRQLHDVMILRSMKAIYQCKVPNLQENIVRQYVLSFRVCLTAYRSRAMSCHRLIAVCFGENYVLSFGSKKTRYVTTAKYGQRGFNQYSSVAHIFLLLCSSIYIINIKDG